MTIDDSGISYAYARWWAEGRGPVYAPGGYVVEGYSNFMWVLVLALAELAGWGAESAGKVLGSAAGLGAMFLCAWAGRLASGRGDVGWRWWDVVPLLLLVGTLEYVTWAQSGLENGLYALLMMAGCAAVMWERAHPTRWPWSAPLVVALALTRPDGLMYGIILGGYKLLGALTDRRGGRQLAWFFAVSLGGWGLYQAWHWLVFQDLLPNTYYSKKPGDDHAKEGLAYLKKYMDSAPWALPWGLAALGLLVERSWERLLLGGLVAAWIFFILMVGGDWMPGGRFISFGLPMLALLAHQGVERLERWRAWLVARAGQPARGGAALASTLWLAALVLTACGWWAVTRAQATAARWSETGWCHYCEVKDRAIGLKGAAQAHDMGLTSALTFDFGGFAWEATPAFLPIDYLGLCDPLIARINAINDSVSRGQAKRLYDHHVWEELGMLPTFIYLPRRWWAVEHAREYHESYVDLTRRARGWMGKTGHRPDTRLGVSRMTWVHLYPPVNRFVYKPLGHDMVVLGARRQDDQVGVALVPVGPQARRVREVLLRVDGVPTVRHALFGGLDEVRASWQDGEPYWLEVTLPSRGAQVEIGLVLSTDRPDASPRAWTTIEATAPDPALTGWHMPRNPAHHEGLRNKPLELLQEKLWALEARRIETHDWTLGDPQLARELARAGALQETLHDRARAYTMYTYALRADRAQAPRHYRHVIATRPERRTSDWAIERHLIRRVHATRATSAEVAWLLDHLSARGLDTRRAYLLARLPEAITLTQSIAGADKKSTFKPKTYEPKMWPPLLKNASFEGRSFGAWEVTGEAFGKQPSAWTDDLTRRVRGVRGDRFATSYARGRDRDTGALRSPPFTIQGDAITLLVAGGSGAKTAAELLVDDKVVLSARGDRERSMRPVFWDVRPWRGKQARVRLRDDDTGAWGWIAADDLRMIPSLVDP